MVKKTVLRSSEYVFCLSKRVPNGFLVKFDHWNDPTDGNDLSFWGDQGFIHPTGVRRVCPNFLTVGKSYMLIEECGEFPAGTVFLAVEACGRTMFKIPKQHAYISFPLASIMEIVTDANDPLCKYQPIFAASGEVRDLLKKLCAYHENNEGYAVLKRLQQVCVLCPDVLSDTKLFTRLESGLFSIALSPVGRHKTVTQSAFLAVSILGEIGNEETVKKMEAARTQKRPYKLDEAFVVAISCVKNRLTKR